MLSYARTQPVSPLRSLALSRLGASSRVAIGLSPVKEAGRAAYAVTDVPAGGFLVLYTGCWYAYTGRSGRTEKTGGGPGRVAGRRAACRGTGVV